MSQGLCNVLRLLFAAAMLLGLTVSMAVSPRNSPQGTTIDDNVSVSMRSKMSHQTKEQD